MLVSEFFSEFSRSFFGVFFLRLGIIFFIRATRVICVFSISIMNRRFVAKVLGLELAFIFRRFFGCLEVPGRLLWLPARGFVGVRRARGGFS